MRRRLVTRMSHRLSREGAFPSTKRTRSLFQPLGPDGHEIAGIADHLYVPAELELRGPCGRHEECVGIIEGHERLGDGCEELGVRRCLGDRGIRRGESSLQIQSSKGGVIVVLHEILPRGLENHPSIVTIELAELLGRNTALGKERHEGEGRQREGKGQSPQEHAVEEHVTNP